MLPCHAPKRSPIPLTKPIGAPPATHPRRRRAGPRRRVRHCSNQRLRRTRCPPTLLPRRAPCRRPPCAVAGWASRSHPATPDRRALARCPWPPSSSFVLATDEDQTERLHRSLSDEALPSDVRTAGALTLLFGLQHTTLLERTLQDTIDNDTAVTLSLTSHLLLLPEVAQLACALRDQRQGRWQLRQTASTTPWLFPGQECARLLGATYLYVKPPPTRHRSPRQP